MSKIYEPLLGSGQIYMHDFGGIVAPVPIGNASDLIFEYEEQEVTQGDFTKSGGGTYASVSRVKNVKVGFKFYDANTSNLTRLLRATSSVITGAPVIAEAGTAYKGALLRFNHPSATAVTITNSAGTTTYLPNVDYELTAAGAIILPSGGIADAQSVIKNYTFGTYDKIEALTKGVQTVGMLFEGFNEAKGGSPVIVDVWKLPLSASMSLALLSEGFAEIPMQGNILKDSSKIGPEISKYFRMQKT